MASYTNSSRRCGVRLIMGHSASTSSTHILIGNYRSRHLQIPVVETAGGTGRYATRTILGRTAPVGYHRAALVGHHPENAQCRAMASTAAAAKPHSLQLHEIPLPGVPVNRKLPFDRVHSALEDQSYFARLARGRVQSLYQRRRQHLLPLQILPIWALSRTVPRDLQFAARLISAPLWLFAGGGVICVAMSKLRDTKEADAERERRHNENAVPFSFETAAATWTVQYAWMLMVARAGLHYALQLSEFAVPKISAYSHPWKFGRGMFPLVAILLGCQWLPVGKCICEHGGVESWKARAGEIAGDGTLVMSFLQFVLYDWLWHRKALAPQFWGQLALSCMLYINLALATVRYVVRYAEDTPDIKGPRIDFAAEC
ncbi:unnamed protein product [Amoebophrya sp. A25]|nr:unnamed protein product [Amoebophrya sp. A25]|eukprot:GSA25T00009083001.1